MSHAVPTTFLVGAELAKGIDHTITVKIKIKTNMYGTICVVTLTYAGQHK